MTLLALSFGSSCSLGITSVWSPRLFGPGQQYEVAGDLVARDEAVCLGGLAQRQHTIEGGLDLAIADEVEAGAELKDVGG